MLNFKKYKWFIYWSAFVVLVGLFIFIAFYFTEKAWLGNVLQTIGTISGIYLTLIIFIQSKEESDKQFREHLEHLQKLNLNQIEALHKTTEKQIETLNENTIKQISSFEHQINEVTQKLAENSILLAEILGRELEKSIEIYENTLRKEKLKYKDLTKFTIARTPVEKEKQLKYQLKRIQFIKDGYDYLVNKYNQVRKFLGFNKQIQLNE